MSLAAFHNITHYFGSVPVLQKINFTIEEQRIYGLVGPNGGGKSTLLALLQGDLIPTEGTIVTDPNTMITLVRQKPDFSPDQSVQDVLLAPFEHIISKLRLQEEKLADPACTSEQMEKNLAAYERIRESYDAADLDAKISRMETHLASFGFTCDLAQKAGTLSGGEQRRLALAAALLAEPDVLMLDEPGNHLDFEGQKELSEIIHNFRGSVILVSHNRYLLDQVCATILELEAGTLTQYTGNYSAYRLSKYRNLAAGQARFQSENRKMQRLEELVKKFQEIATRLADPAWGKRLRAARTKLKQQKERTGSEPILEQKRLDISFSDGQSRSDYAARIKGYSKSFSDECIIRSASFDLFTGERVALVGPNGSGKSTLIKDLMALGNWEHPALKIGPSQRVGYLPQSRSNNPETIEDWLRSDLGLSKDEAYGVASPFGFSWKDMEKVIDTLSGGEYNRLILASILYRKPTFLVLDEPTNHMDIPSREKIEESVLEFTGTVLFVSHDRYLLDAWAGRILAIEDAVINSYSCSFSEYFTFLRPQDSSQKAFGNSPGTNRQSPSQNIIKRIEEAERGKQAIESQMQAALVAKDHKSARKLGSKLEQANTLVSRLYAEWEREN